MEDYNLLVCYVIAGAMIVWNQQKVQVVQYQNKMQEYEWHNTRANFWKRSQVTCIPVKAIPHIARGPIQIQWGSKNF